MSTEPGRTSVIRSRKSATPRCTAAPTSRIETPSSSARCSVTLEPSTRTPLRTPSTTRETPGTSSAASRAYRAMTSSETTLFPSMPRIVGAVSGRPSSVDFEPLGHARHRDDVALELQLRLLQPGGDADQLREMHDRQVVALAVRGRELLLPRVERQVAQRARGDHRVGAGFDRLLDRLDQLAESRVLAGLDDR